MGALQATTLLIRDKCDILIHINVNVEKTVPAYDRIRAFKETCEEYQVPYDIDLSVSGNSYQEILNEIRRIFTRIEEKYPNQKKGIFLSNDTYANMFLNLIFQKYRELPSFYEIIGFDNSPIASEQFSQSQPLVSRLILLHKLPWSFWFNRWKNKKNVPLNHWKSLSINRLLQY